MKTEDPKKKPAKLAETTKKAVAKKTAAGKLSKVSDARTAKTNKSTSDKPAARARKIEQKPLIAESSAKKKETVTIKTKVMSKPKAKISKVAAIKPKPAVKAEKKVPKKRAIIAKAEIKAETIEKPKVKAIRFFVVKAKPVAEAEKKVPINKAVIARTEEAKASPKARVTKVTAIKPKPLFKTATEPPKKAVAVRTSTTTKVKGKIIPKAKPVQKRVVAVTVMPSPKPVVSVKKHKKNDESGPMPDRYPPINSRAKLKIFLPDQSLMEDEAREIFLEGLPEEYGENSVMALAVDPKTVFVDWEVIPREIAAMEGDLNLRFYDITGTEFNDCSANTVFDIPISKRVGNGFFAIHMPGRDVVVAVGIINAVSGFIPIVRSDMVSFPELLTFDELGIVQKLFESGIPVGY